MKSPGRRLASPVTALAFITLGIVACLMPAHNDTWWHLRTGYETLRDHAPLFTDRFSFTAYGNFFWNHSWLAQAVFYLLYSVGGFPLLTAFCATLTLAAWALVWRQMQGPLDMRLVLFAVACAGATTIWSVRPQVFSIVMLPLVAILVARDRWWLNPRRPSRCGQTSTPESAMGLVVVGASVAAALLDRERLLPRAACFAASVVATLATPLGVRSWTELVASVGRSRANRIQEWQPTALPPDQMLFSGSRRGLRVATDAALATVAGPRGPGARGSRYAGAANCRAHIAKRAGLPDVGCAGIDPTDLRDGARAEEGRRRAKVESGRRHLASGRGRCRRVDCRRQCVEDAVADAGMDAGVTVGGGRHPKLSASALQHLS